MPRYTFKVQKTPSGQIIPEDPARTGQRAAASAKVQQQARKENPANASQADEPVVPGPESPDYLPEEATFAETLPAAPEQRPAFPETRVQRTAERLAQGRERARGVREGYTSLAREGATRAGRLMSKIRESMTPPNLTETEQGQRALERLRRLLEE